MSVLYFKQVDATWPQQRLQRTEETADALRSMMERQRRIVIARVRAGSVAEFEEGWRSSLEEIVFEQNMQTATLFGDRTAQELDRKQFDPERAERFLRVNARHASRNIVESVERDVGNAVQMDGSQGASGVFATVASVSVLLWAGSMVANAANFGAHEAARAAGGQKRWQVNSGNPRSSHAALDGETIPIGDVFSNGLMWPGYPGDASEVANCMCSLVFL